MKKKAFTIILCMLVIPAVMSQDLTTIEILSTRYNSFNHEEVVFEGYIERYVAGSATTSSYYEIKGEYGATIRVNTTQPSPEINQRYRVTGTMTIHNGEPLIIEKHKRMIHIQGYSLTIIQNPQGAGSVSPAGRIDIDPGESVNISAIANRNFRFENWTIDNRVVSTNENYNFVMPEANTVIVANFAKDNTLWIVGGAALGLLVLALIIVLALRKPRQMPPPPPMPTMEPASTKFKEEPATETVRINVDQDYTTIKLQQSAPATVKFIPGELEILNGLDKGKSFKMAGYPTSDGSVATIGRDHDGWQSQVAPERQYAHIRLKDESNTLSRMQAELVHRGGTLYLKNLSKVNPAQVDGEDVPVNEVVEIKPDSIIKTGFIEFRYKV